MKDSQKKKIAIIDGNSWLHRAYHAVPPIMFLEDKTPTNAIHGFLRMFLSFYNHAQPDAIICAFDAGIPKFRLEAVKQYKAQRKPMDNELKMQFPIIEEILKSMDIPVIKVDGWEGDDILGTLANMCEQKNYESLLITGDKDANQLASNLTKIVNMKKGVSDVVLFGPDEVLEKYGVRVDQFIDYLALMGDSSDNIPGVPGIGPKSASKLLQQFNSIDGIYENIECLKGKQKQNILENKESAYVSKKAATISKNVPITLDIDNIYFPSFDKEKVTQIFLNYKLKSSLDGLFKAIGEEMDDNEEVIFENSDSLTNNKQDNDKKNEKIFSEKEPNVNFENYYTNKEAYKFLNNLISNNEPFAIALDKKIEEVAVQTSLFDLDLNVQDNINKEYKNLLLAISNNKHVAIFEEEQVADVLKKCIDIKNDISCENFKQILKILFKQDSDKTTLISSKDLFKLDFFDNNIAAYLLNSSKSEYDANSAYLQVYKNPLPTINKNEENVNKNDKDYVKIKNKNLFLRLSRRASVSYVLKENLINLLQKQNLYDIYKDIEHPLTAVLVYTERNGCKLDIPKLNSLSVNLASMLQKYKEEIIELAGEEFNIDSPKQLGHILFEVLGLPAKKKTKTGYSTNAAVLEELSTMHELPSRILKYREYAKLKSTYVDALPDLCDKNSLIHTTFHQTKTTTGRLSSTDPNIQNIPTRSKLGNSIRECFIPLKKDDVILTADYSQIELRMLAHLSKDQGLIDAFNCGEDFHAVTASKVFNVDIKDVNSNQRRIAKAVNFGIIYGQQAFGLAQTLHIERSVAKDMIDKYFLSYPKVRKYLDDVIQLATNTGYATTLFGRRRYIPELTGPKRYQAFGQRTAMNHPMQGSAADIIKIAMINVQKEIIKQNIKAKCMLQVHDELDFSVSKEHIDLLTKVVKEQMENAASLLVPLKVDISVGNNWSEAK